jgi:hypothetical protein
VLRALERHHALIFLPSRMEKGNNATVYDYWRQIVQHYTERRFTNVTDVLPALSGLAGAFSRATGERYLAGLWEGDLVSSLNWHCRPPVEYLEGDPRLDYPSPLSDSEILEVMRQLKGKKELVKQKIVKAYRQVDYLAPSWSWASVIHGRVVFSPSSGDHTYVQAWVKTLWKATVIDVDVVRSTQDPYGSVTGGYLVLRGPFARIPHPMHEAGNDYNLPTLRKFIRTREMSGSYTSQFEFDLKHRPFANQVFGLLQTGVYEVLRSGDRLFPRPSTQRNTRIWLSNENQPMLQMLLIESCEDTSMDRALMEHVRRPLGSMRWRRLCHFEIPMTEMKLQSDEEEYGAGIRRDLSSQVWEKKTICLV